MQCKLTAFFRYREYNVHFFNKQVEIVSETEDH